MENPSPLCDWIIDRFPTSAKSFESSMASKLLQSMSLFFIFLDYSFPEEVFGSIKQHRRLVELGAPVLQALVPLLDSKDDPFGENNVAEGASFKVKSNTQRKNKRTKRPIMDETPFQGLQISVPASREEAEALASSVLADQKIALQVIKFALYHLSRH
jgi:hypothetical protein